VQLTVNTQGQAEVGVSAVDKSVFILAENRMNLQQVFDKLEQLYMQPQAEIDSVSFYPTATTVGAADVFKNAGVVVMTNNKVPVSKQYQTQQGGSFLSKIFHSLGFGGRNGVFDNAELQKGGMAVPAVTMTMVPTTTIAATTTSQSTLADVQRVRQFFPETWLWFDATTDSNGKLIKKVNVPDSITTWMLRVTGISKDKGLGVAESSIKVFQPFFLSIDLPYSAIRGEEFPVKVSVYNYLNTAQSVQVSIDKSPWFDLLDPDTQTINIGPNDIGSAQFTIRRNWQ
jgi:CD109 antigen